MPMNEQKRIKRIGRKIVTINAADMWRYKSWCAYDYDLGATSSPYGWGETEREAVDDLMEQLEEME